MFFCWHAFLDIKVTARQEVNFAFTAQKRRIVTFQRFLICQFCPWNVNGKTDYKESRLRCFFFFYSKKGVNNLFSGFLCAYIRYFLLPVSFLSGRLAYWIGFILHKITTIKTCRTKFSPNETAQKMIISIHRLSPVLGKM